MAKIQQNVLNSEPFLHGHSTGKETNKQCAITYRFCMVIAKALANGFRYERRMRQH